MALTTNTINMDYGVASGSSTAVGYVNSNNLSNLYTTTGTQTLEYKWPTYAYYPNLDPFSYEEMKKLMDKYLPAETVNKKESKVANKTVDLFDDKAEDQKLLEEYNIVGATGCLTETGWEVLGKLLLAEKREAIVEKLRTDKASKKKKTD